MRYPIISLCFMAILAAAPAAFSGPTAPALEMKGDETAEQVQQIYAKAIAELLPGLDKNDQGIFRAFELLVQRAGRPGAEKERAACCGALADVLALDASSNVKVWVLKQLTVLGRSEAVPAEAKLLAGTDPLLRETARRALQQNPAPEAVAALRAALGEASDPAWRAALILSLGARKDAAAVPAIAKCMSAKEPVVVEAALAALGHIGGADAANALVDAQANVPESLRPAAADAHIKCAERFLAEGRTRAAVDIYRRYQKAPAPESIRQAALAGLLCSSDDAGDMVLKILCGKDAGARQVAETVIADLNPQATRSLLAGLESLPPKRRVGAMSALASRGVKGIVVAAVEATRSNDPETRLAGLAAVGHVGNALSVPLLLEALHSQGDVGATARASLLRLPGDDVNRCLAGAVKAEKDPTRRSAIIGVLEARGAPELVAVMLPDATSDDAVVRRQAMRALGTLARPAQVPAILPGLFKAAAGGERDDAERAIMFVCNRIRPPDEQAAPILEAYARAGAAEKLILLPVLGRIGGPKALATLKEALGGSDSQARDAAIRGLSYWPDGKVAGDLLELAKSATEESQRTAALRGLVRVATQRDALSAKEALGFLTSAMKLAQRDPERNLILDRANAVRGVETLRFVAPYLDEPALCTSAGRTAVDLAYHGGLKSREKAEFEAALRKVIAQCKDKGVVERAEKELRGE